MIGLLIKDLYYMKKSVLTYSIIVLVLSVYAYIRNYQMILICVLPIVCSTLIISGIRSDLNMKWSEFSLSMPLTKLEIKISKYIEYLVLCLVGALAGGVIGIIGTTVKDNMTIELVLTFIIVGLVISFLAGAILLFLINLIGGEKGETIDILMIVVYIFVGGIYAGITKFLTTYFSFDNQIVNIILLGVSVVMFAISAVMSTLDLKITGKSIS